MYGYQWNMPNRKVVVEIKSDENAELIPMLTFDNTIRTIFVSSCRLVGWVIIIASPTDNSSIKRVPSPCTVIPIGYNYN